MSQIIFISGAAGGHGILWAESFLKKGCSVAVASTDVDFLSHLQDLYQDRIMIVQPDVASRTGFIVVISKICARFGRIDVVINNENFYHPGQAFSESCYLQLQTGFNRFLWLTQAALPLMRLQGKGHIIQVSAFAGFISEPFLFTGDSSSFAIEGISEAIASEAMRPGIKFSLIGPDGIAVSWAGNRVPGPPKHKTAKNGYINTTVS